ncbi:mCG140493, partial [Mus musculus]
SQHLQDLEESKRECLLTAQPSPDPTRERLSNQPHGLRPGFSRERNVSGENTVSLPWSYHSPTWRWRSFYWLSSSFPCLLWLPSTPALMRGMKTMTST